MSQRVVLCEGYSDRAFWSGWLQHLGCRPAETAEERRDQWGRPVTKGRHLFYTSGGDRILVEPCLSREQVAQAARAYIAERTTRPVQRIVLNVDSDRRVGAEMPEVGQIPDDLRHLILREQQEDERDTMTVHGIEILPVVWECPDRNAAGIPEQQTLERLVSAAIAEAYPGRDASVARWLADPPTGATTHKAHGLSYLAKWYASHGTEDFYAQVWRDAPVAAALESRLRAIGAWAKAERLISS